MKTVLAADLGGTKCKFALVGEDLSVQSPRVVRTSRDRDSFVASLDREFTSLRDEQAARGEPPCAIGIGAAGMVPRGERCLQGVPNLPIDDFPLRDHLEERHGLPVTILNDGRASAWGEYLRGEAKGKDPLLVLFFGTGIGIGLIADGKPYEGADNAAGEIGHTVYAPGGRRCVCGRRGCFEAYCGGGPMTARAGKEIGPAPDGERWTVSDLIIRAPENAAARAILDEAETAAGAMVASLCTLLNPSAVVLGGGVLSAWPELRDKIETATRAWCSDAVATHLEFVLSVGGSDAVLWGAATATGALAPPLV